MWGKLRGLKKSDLLKFDLPQDDFEFDLPEDRFQHGPFLRLR